MTILIMHLCNQHAYTHKPINKHDIGERSVTIAMFVLILTLHLHNQNQNLV